MENELTDNGFDAVQISGIDTSSLSGLDALYLLNPSNNNWSLSSQEISELNTAVSNGLDLVIFDRRVTDAGLVLPSGEDIIFHRMTGDNANIDVYSGAPNSFVSQNGLITDSMYDGGSSSNHGYADLSSLPLGAAPLLTNGNTDQITAFSYEHGNGTVLYSTIPLDHYSQTEFTTITPDEVSLIVANALDYVLGIDGIGPVELTEEEIAMVTDVWNVVGSFRTAYTGFADNYIKGHKKFFGQDLDIPGYVNKIEKGYLDNLQIKLGDAALPGEQLSMDELFKASAQFDTLEEALEHMLNQKHLGISLGGVLKFGATALDVIDIASKAYTGMKAALEGDNEEAFGTVYDILTGVASGVAVAHVVGSATVATAATVVAGVGIGATVAVGGVAIVVGLGVGLIAKTIEEKLDLVENVTDGFEGASLKIVQTLQEGFAATWLDFEPRTISLEYGGVIFGAGGNDSLTGSRFDDDLLVGGYGNDTLDGGLGADTMRGGDGKDVYFVDNVNDKVVERAFDYWGSDTDKVYSSVSYKLPRATENLILTGDENLKGRGNKWDNKLVGNSGDNNLKAGKGEDIILGKGGDDTIIVSFDADKDVYKGGAGNDTLKFDIGTAPAVVNLKANNLLVAFTLDEVYGIENVTGTKYGDYIRGNGKDNILIGKAGSDKIYGGGGADTINGGRKKDDLYAGKDLSTDTFIFNSVKDMKGGFGLEKVHQFDLNRDILDFSGIDANVDISGNQAFEYTAGPDRYSIWAKLTRSGDIKIFGDNNGDKKADFKLLLDDLHSPDGYDPVSLESIFIL